MSLKVVRFSAEWCQPCKLLSKVMDRISENMPDVSFETIDIDEQPELASSMAVRAVPTMVFIKDGKIVDVIVGLQKEAYIVSMINKWK